MSDFVHRQYKDKLVHTGKDWRNNLEIYARTTKNYSDLLKQPLTLGMFVPCKLVGGVWIVFEKPTLLNTKSDAVYHFDMKEYKKAKQKCLFEGFEVFRSVSALISFSKNGLGRLDWNLEGSFMMGYSKESTIEDLFNSHYVELILTSTALNNIGL